MRDRVIEIFQSVGSIEKNWDPSPMQNFLTVSQKYILFKRAVHLKGLIFVKFGTIVDPIEN